jgi:hypothetical protein
LLDVAKFLREDGLVVDELSMLEHAFRGLTISVHFSD